MSAVASAWSIYDASFGLKLIALRRIQQIHKADQISVANAFLTPLKTGSGERVLTKKFDKLQFVVDEIGRGSYGFTIV